MDDGRWTARVTGTWRSRRYREPVTLERKKASGSLDREGRERVVSEKGRLGCRDGENPDYRKVSDLARGRMVVWVSRLRWGCRSGSGAGRRGALSGGEGVADGGVFAEVWRMTSLEVGRSVNEWETNRRMGRRAWVWSAGNLVDKQEGWGNCIWLVWAEESGVMCNGRRIRDGDAKRGDGEPE
jgi:hypothetical protein